MPVVVVVAKFTERQCIAKSDLQVCVSIPILDGEKPEEAVRKAIGLTLVPMPLAVANAVKFTALGSTRIYAIGQRVRMSQDEVVFCQQKYPNMIEVLGDGGDDSGVSGGDFENELRAERDAARGKHEKAAHELEQLKIENRGIKARLEDSERRTVIAIEGAKLADVKLKGAEASIEAAQKELAELQAKHDKATKKAQPGVHSIPPSGG